MGEAGSPHGVGVGLRVEVPGLGEAAAMERRVKALAGKLQVTGFLSIGLVLCLLNSCCKVLCALVRSQ